MLGSEKPIGLQSSQGNKDKGSKAHPWTPPPGSKLQLRSSPTDPVTMAAKTQGRFCDFFTQEVKSREAKSLTQDEPPVSQTTDCV